MSAARSRRAALVIKRALDIAGAGGALVVLSPVLLAVSVAVGRSSPGGILFRQERAGRDGRTFRIHKFRTMTIDPPDVASELRAARDEARITRVGRILRRTSLDELPQLIDIVRGDMSLVGPRPDLVHHAERYTAHQRERLRMRPGLTGWAQVHGRQMLSFEERFKYDVWYVDHWSLRLDLKIMALTVRKVLTGDGVPPPGYVFTTPSSERRDEGDPR